MILWGAMPPTTRKSPEAINPTMSNEQRHRIRVMRALGRFAETLEKVAAMVVFRFRSTEAGDTLLAHRTMVDTIRSPAQALDVLGELMEGQVRGAIRPPQLDAMVTETIEALFAAATAGDHTAWPAHLLRAALLQRRMFDPYESAGAEITRLASGTYVIALCDHVPIASQANSVAKSALPETSKSVTRSVSRNVRTAIESQSMTA